MIEAMTRSRLVAWALCVVGLVVVGVITFVDMEVPDAEVASSMFFSLAFVASPWLVFAAFCRRWKSDLGVVVAGALLLAFELYVYHGVFIDPRSSTAALAYVTKPFIQVFGLLPLGLVVGWVGDRLVAESEET